MTTTVSNTITDANKNIKTKEALINNSKQPDLFIDNNEPMKNMSASYFISNEYNYDIDQCLKMQNSKNDLTNKVNNEKINNQSISSVTDSNEYLGCLNRKCSNLNDKENGINKPNNLDDYKTKNIKHLNSNIEKRNLNDYISMRKKVNKSLTNNPYASSILLENINNIITFVYILLVCVLLVYSVVTKNNYILSVIVLTLLYVSYKFFLIYKKNII